MLTRARLEARMNQMTVLGLYLRGAPIHSVTGASNGGESMQHLRQEQIMAMAQPIPMSRNDKLERWATLIERSSEPVRNFHHLEYLSEKDLDQLTVRHSAFAHAARDPVLKEAGLIGDKLGDSMRFFELSKEDVHDLSCDCFGHVSNHRAANRIRQLKSSQPPANIFSRLFGWMAR
jgi:hypothetical protein